MKKVLAITLVLIALATAVYAGDINVGLKGIVGTDNSGNEGPLMGAGIDVAYNLGEHFGIVLCADSCGANITYKNGLTLKDNFYLSVPVMLYCSYDIKNLEVNAGAGLSTVFREDSISVCPAGELKTTLWFNNFGIYLGLTGNLDCIPSLDSKTNTDGSRTYKFKESDWTNNSLLCSLGVVYKIETT